MNFARSPILYNNCEQLLLVIFSAFRSLNFFKGITGFAVRAFSDIELKFPIQTPPEGQKIQLIYEQEEYLLRYNIYNALNVV